MRGHVVRSGTTGDIGFLLTDNLSLVVDGCMVGSAHPVSHGSRQSLAPVGLLDHGRGGGIFQDIFGESVGPLGTIGRTDGRCAVTALFETDVAVGCTVVARLDLELNPRSGQVCAALHSALEAQGKAHERCGVWPKLDRLQRVIEVCTGRAVAIPIVIIEEVGFLLV